MCLFTEWVFKYGNTEGVLYSPGSGERKSFIHLDWVVCFLLLVHSY